MKFLYPQFLYALIALLIPIIIHLFNFRKFQTVYFSNVRFLKEIKTQTKAKSQLKHILILLSRMLAITALVLAFAQPYIPVNDQIIENKHAVSVFLDNSFSMNAENDEGSLLLTAKDKAEIIAESYKNTDDFQIITNNLQGKHQRIINKEIFIDEINQIETSSISTSLSKILERQKHTISSSNAKKKTIYIISDFQESITDLENFKVDSSLNIRLLPVTGYVTDNLYIDSCWLNTPNPILGEDITLSVRLVNKGEERTDIPIKLTINNQQKAISNTDIIDQAIVELNFICNTKGWQEGTISVSDYPISYDDNFYFTFEIKENLLVQSIYEEESSQALEQLFGSDEYINYTTQNIRQINNNELMTKQLIILDGLLNISSGFAKILLEFVETGGALMIFPSREINIEDYKIFLRNFNCDYYTSLDESSIKITELNDKHPLFTGVFEKLDDKLNFPQIKQRFIQTKFNQTNKRPLLSLENGESVISEYKFKKGKIYLSNIGLEPEFGNFSKHALFVPILYNIASHSIGNKPLYDNIGQEYIHTDIQFLSNEIYTIEGNKTSFIPEVKGNKLGVYDQIRSDGHYTVNNQKQNIIKLALNYQRQESNLELLNLEDLEDFCNNYNNIKIINKNGNSLSQEIDILNKGKRLWKLCIIFALIFLALETIIIKWL